MAKDYGVYKEATDLWVKVASPLELDVAENAQTWDENDAMVTATYLNGLGEGSFRVGRPDDRHG
jgi:hypothetical protein